MRHAEEVGDVTTRDANHYTPTPEDFAWADDVLLRLDEARSQLAHLARMNRLRQVRADEVRAMDSDAARALAVKSLRDMASWIDRTSPYVADLDCDNPHENVMRWITVGASHPWGG